VHPVIVVIKEVPAAPVVVAPPVAAKKKIKG
jgi:hypothetical protein